MRQAFLLLVCILVSLRMSKSLSIKSYFRSATTTTTKTAAALSDENASPSKRQRIAPTTDELPSSSSSSTSTSTSGALTPAPVWAPFEAMNPAWKSALTPELQKPYFKTLLKFLDAECKSHTVFPPSNAVFNAFEMCPLDQVKVRNRTTLLRPLIQKAH